jgi:hypothetical protein
LQIPLRGLFGAMGGSEGDTRRKNLFTIRSGQRHWRSPNYVVLGWLIDSPRHAGVETQVAINVTNMAATVYWRWYDLGIAGAAIAA